jgi:tetratricopeptide (TPR) repeat protein/tRNA A-37 threonylcarbamoyl transferase component Bud32
MATVFLAEDLKHHRRVAIKVLDPEIAQAVGPERFLREIETVARLTHPHILPLFDSGVADGLLFYVMPFVEGESLRDRLTREKQLPLDDALRIAREVADALSYAHAHGLVHRDIKPENVLLESGHAVVADFGIARAVAAAGTEKLTATGIAVGTPAYMSPEQAAGSRDLDGRSDLYSLACVLYEMLAGVPPFAGTTAESLAHQHLNVTPRPVTELRPAVPAAVAAALQRALAKVPADRFNPVALFGEALGSTATTPPTLIPAAPSPRHPARWLAAAVAVALALVAFAAWQHWGPFTDWFGGEGARHTAKKDWILVAEFDGPPGDSTLAAATRSLVSAALDQSTIVATVPRDQIQLALQQAGKPANTRVDADLARQLAYRRSVRAVLEGSIERLGKGYSVVLRVVDAESLKVVLTESAIAKNEDALIPALGRLAEELRAGLGEHRSALRATRAMGDAATPSFEAYQLYVQAARQSSSYEYSRSAALHHQALALDPDFAVAWSALANCYWNQEKMDSCMVARHEALRRPERLTARQLLATQAACAADTGNLRGALAANDRFLQDNPGSYGVLNGSGIYLTYLGRFEEALEAVRRAEASSPFGPNQVLIGNEAEYLMNLGRFDEARQVLRRLRGPIGLTRRATIEIMADNWSVAESLSAVVVGDPRVSGDQLEVATGLLATTQAARGALRAAAGTLDRQREEALRSGSVYYMTRPRLMLAVVSGGAIGIPPDDWVPDNSARTLLSRGLRAATAGDRVAARRWLDAARAKPRYELLWQGATPVLLAARIEELEGRWDEAAHLLQPVACQSVQGGMARFPAGMCTVRWYLADAFERLGHPDSAAVYLERAVTDYADERGYRGIVVPFVHLRLITLYARMGRVADAERHLAVARKWFTTPDPEVRRMLAEATGAVKAARGMARPQRAGTQASRDAGRGPRDIFVARCTSTPGPSRPTARGQAQRTSDWTTDLKIGQTPTRPVTRCGRSSRLCAGSRRASGWRWRTTSPGWSVP